MSDKKFGLIIPKKPDRFKMRTNSIFDDESDEDEKQRKRPKIPQKKLDIKSKIKKESLEDPSIYEYDSIYDDMKAKQAESIAPTERKSSRYIDTLLKAADKRKMEYERRIDKKIQAEREKEGDLYKDKEAFVTSSYKKKLQEKEEEEERERRENMLNDMMDITKQKDLSGFYRHFLKQTVGEEKIPVFGEKHIKHEPVVTEEINSPRRVNENFKENVTLDHLNIDQDSDGVDIDSDSDDKNSNTSGETSSKKHAYKNTSVKFGESVVKSHKSKAKKHSVVKDKSKFSPQDKNRKTHSHFLKQTVGEEKVPVFGEKHIKQEPVVREESNFPSRDENIKENLNLDHSNIDQDSDGIDIDSDSDDSVSKETSNKKHAHKSASAKYNDSEDKIQKSKVKKHSVFKDTSKLSPQQKKQKIHTQNSSNISNSDSEPSSDEGARYSEKCSPSDVHGSKRNIRRHDSLSSDDNEVDKNSDEPKKQIKVVKKDKTSIYTKRTVGDVFTAAQARYFRRVSEKNEK